MLSALKFWVDKEGEKFDVVVPVLLCAVVTLVFDDASIEVPEGAESDVCVRASHVLATPQTFRVFTVDNTATGAL